MRARAVYGFTLIELLTVIAIIAVLAAILLPVMATAKEKARQATCMSNMKDIYLGLGSYTNDNSGTYPPVLLGVAERADGTPWLTGDATPPVDASAMRHSPLFPAYVKSIASFHCPDFAPTSQGDPTTANFPATAGWSGPATYGTHGLPFTPASTPVQFYRYDTYDSTSVIGADSAVRQVAYCTDWTAALNRGLDTRRDNPNQLKYKSAPTDKTVITICNMHVTTNGSKVTPTLFASGTSKTLDSARVNARGWNVAGED